MCKQNRDIGRVPASASDFSRPYNFQKGRMTQHKLWPQTTKYLPASFGFPQTNIIEYLVGCLPDLWPNIAYSVRVLLVHFSSAYSPEEIKLVLSSHICWKGNSQDSLKFKLALKSEQRLSIIHLAVRKNKEHGSDESCSDLNHVVIKMNMTAS